MHCLDSSACNDDEKAQYLATCVPGLAHVLEKEIHDIQSKFCDGSFHDISDVATSGNAAVTFCATRHASLYALCWLRSAHQLLELVAATDADTSIQGRQDIHDFVRDKVNVKELLGDGQGGLLTISVKAIMNNPQQLPKDLSHSHFTALEVKNALVDVVREMRGDRPNVNIEDPDVPLVCILRGTSNGGASLSLYKSLHPPGSLHRRGYRQGSAIHKAAMKESMAAGLLLEAGWKEQVENARDGKDSMEQLRFVDPMAGSGSLVLEAGMIAADIAPGIMRIRCGLDAHRMPPVTKWKSNSDRDTVSMWKEVLLDATKRAKNGIHFLNRDPSPIQIIANDIYPGAVDIMESALANAGLQNFVDVFEMDCYDLALANHPKTHTIVTTNPPWGVRLTEDIEESWEGLKHFARDKCPSGTQLFVLSGNKSATATLKLKRDRMIPIQTGDQHLRFIQYTIRNGNLE
jgi:putative N6-adenine-specific DNA methylase